MELKRVAIVIGEKDFKIKELTCASRNAIFDIVGTFTFAEILKSLMPVLDGLGIDLKKKGGEADQMGELIKLGLQNENVWGGLMACLISVLQIGPQIICLSLDTMDEETENYILANLTVTQEPKILQQIIELNELPETVKNYKSLLNNVRNLIQTKN